MNDILSLVSGYLDDVLTKEEFDQLETWLNEDPKHRQVFAEAVFLENRIRAEV